MKAKTKYGVPCSRLKDRVTDVDVNCTSEEEAMALAFGAILANKNPVVYMQNSGLGAIVDIVASLYKCYGIPLPKLLLSIRHKPKHHEFMGKITQTLLKLMEYDGDVEIIEQ